MNSDGLSGLGKPKVGETGYGHSISKLLYGLLNLIRLIIWMPKVNRKLPNTDYAVVISSIKLELLGLLFERSNQAKSTGKFSPDIVKINKPCGSLAMEGILLQSKRLTARAIPSR